MQHIKEENVVKEELQFVNDATQFHTFEKVQYTMPQIPRIKECPTRYMTPFATIMEPWETFVSKVIKCSSVQTRLPMRVKASKVEPKGWGDNGIMVTLANL
jgi:hypothetical protein